MREITCQVWIFDTVANRFIAWRSFCSWEAAGRLRDRLITKGVRARVQSVNGY